jgi:hypothetical protein
MSVRRDDLRAKSGGFDQERAEAAMLDEIQKLDSPLAVRIVVLRKASK